MRDARIPQFIEGTESGRAHRGYFIEPVKSILIFLDYIDLSIDYSKTNNLMSPAVITVFVLLPTPKILGYLKNGKSGSVTESLSHGALMPVAGMLSVFIDILYSKKILEY